MSWALFTVFWWCMIQMLESYTWCWWRHPAPLSSLAAPECPGWGLQHSHWISDDSQYHHRCSLKTYLMKSLSLVLSNWFSLTILLFEKVEDWQQLSAKHILYIKPIQLISNYLPVIRDQCLSHIVSTFDKLLQSLQSSAHYGVFPRV